MKYSFLLISIFSFYVSAEEYPSCDFEQSKRVAFSSEKTSDLLTVKAQGEPCYAGELTISITMESGEVIHEYKTKFIHWDSRQPDFDIILGNYVNHIIDNAITRTSSLPDKFKCEIEEPDCVPYERNVIPLNEYYELKRKNLPMLQHETYYEGWGAWIYDSELKKVVLVYEGGV